MPAANKVKKIEIITADQLRQRREAARIEEETRLAKAKQAEEAKARKPIMELFDGVMEALGGFIKDKSNANESACAVSIEDEPWGVIQGTMAELVKNGYSVDFTDDGRTPDLPGAPVRADIKRTGHINLSW